MRYDKYRVHIENILIETFNDENLVCIHNQYCERCNLIDDMLQTEDEIYEQIECLKPVDAFHMGKYSYINAFDKYFTFDGYGNLMSVDAERHIIENYLTDIACYILDHEESFDMIY